MHQLEHDYMYEKMRKGEYFNNGDYMAKSTLMGIMARESAYCGEAITWDEMMKSERSWAPQSYDLNQSIPEPKVAVPGEYEFI